MINNIQYNYGNFSSIEYGWKNVFWEFNFGIVKRFAITVRYCWTCLKFSFSVCKHLISFLIISFLKMFLSSSWFVRPGNHGVWWNCQNLVTFLLLFYQYTQFGCVVMSIHHFCCCCCCWLICAMVFNTNYAWYRGLHTESHTKHMCEVSGQIVRFLSISAHA